MRLTRTSLLLVPLLASGCVVSVADETLKTERRSFAAEPITRARFETGSGELRIDGRSGAGSVELVADYKGSDRAVLEDLKLTAEVRGGTLVVKTESLSSSWFRGARIDLTVTLPSRLPLELRDGSGNIDVSGMDAELTIQDGSGSIDIARVGGNIKIDDGSGSIQVRDAGGEVAINDGSGSIEVEHVRGGVRIEDGSGGIDVRDVGGVLDVPHKGSGSISHEGVRGEVRIPKRKEIR